MKKFIEHVDFLLEVREQSKTGHIGKTYLKSYKFEPADIDLIERERIKSIEACMEQM